MVKPAPKKNSQGLIDKILHGSDNEKSGQVESVSNEGDAEESNPEKTEKNSDDAGASSELQAHQKFDKFNKGN